MFLARSIQRLLVAVIFAKFEFKVLSNSVSRLVYSVAVHSVQLGEVVIDILSQTI